MNLLLQIFVLVALLIIFFQDLKMRAIHSALLVFIFTAGIILMYLENRNASWLLYNGLFLMATFTGLYLYIIIKHKSFINPFKELIGLGDLLFFVAILPFFATYNYILYFITGLIFTIAMVGCLNYFKRDKLIPLAGIIALYLFLLKGFSLLSGRDIFFLNIF